MHWLLGKSGCHVSVFLRIVTWVVDSAMVTSIFISLFFSCFSFFILFFCSQEVLVVLHRAEFEEPICGPNKSEEAISVIIFSQRE